MDWPSKDPADYLRGQPPPRRWPREPLIPRDPTSPGSWGGHWRTPKRIWLAALFAPQAAGALIAAAIGEDPLRGAFPIGSSVGWLAVGLIEWHHRRRSRRPG